MTQSYYAVRDFEAATPEDALQLARDFYDEDPGELDFRSYDDNAGMEYIQIWGGERGTLASWESDDYRLRKAAPELLSALKLILPHYAGLLRAMGSDLTKCANYQSAKTAVANAEPQNRETRHDAA